MEDRSLTEWRQLAHRLIVPTINRAVFNPLEKSGKHGNAETRLN
jgi:hypothetical protein